MHAELGLIDRPGSALSFAAGCFLASMMERNATMTAVQKSVQTLAILALLALAGAASLGTSRALPVDPSTGMLLALLVLIYAGTAVMTFMRGSDALVHTASIMLGLSAGSYLALLASDFGLANAEMYRSLASECMAAWAVLLGLGAVMRRRVITA
jgi:hypothetical protein